MAGFIDYEQIAFLMEIDFWTIAVNGHLVFEAF